MSKRARYDGGYADGVIVEYDDDGTTRRVHVKQGGLLPAEVPAKVRDELLDREDWSAQAQKSDKE